MRIVVAMSGGVDSSVAAALLVDAGYEVVGLSMQLYDQREAHDTPGGCCSLEDVHDARRVADALGIPHYTVNFERRFRDTVVSNFVSEYVAGRTPIPCVHCNADLKFSTLLDRARALDADRVATGHFARLDRDPASGRHRLRRGADRARDQSYFLFSLDQDQLDAAAFPVGSMTKAAVRDYARARGLPVADKPESREICFVPDGDYASFVERQAPTTATSGSIVDTAGVTVGSHGGVHRFTVGQRRGLGLSSREPLYVLGLEATTQRVIVGPRAQLRCRSLEATDVSWVAGASPPGAVRVRAQIRYQHVAAPATVTASGERGGLRAHVEFDEPQTAITPGQAVVFYDADVVVGGGWIQ